MRLKVSNVCQLLDKSKFWGTTQNGVTFTNNRDGTFTINGTATYDTGFLQPVFQFQTSNPGYHTYLLDIGQYSGNANAHGVVYFYDDNVDSSVALIGTESSSAVIRKINGPIAGRGTIIQARFAIAVFKGATVTNWTIRPQLFDLTEMYGAGNEPTTVAQFRQDFPNEMYEYSPVCWKKFRRLKYVTETKNLFDVNNAVPYRFDNDNPASDQVFVKDGIYTTRLNNYNIGSGLRIKDGWTLPAGVYTLSVKVVDCSDFGTGGYVNIGFYYKIADGTWHVLTKPNYSYAPGTTLSFAINIPEHIELRLYLNYQNMNGQPRAGYVSYKDIQIEKGSTATPYQPYGYLPLNRGKYIANKEPVQLLDKSKYKGTSTREGITFTNNGDGTWTVVGTAPDVPANKQYVSTTIIVWNLEFSKKHFIPGHKIIVTGGVSTDSAGKRAVVQWVWGWTGGYDAANSWEYTIHTIRQYPEDKLLEWNNYIELRVYAGATVNFTFKPQFFDRTEMYGAGNEPTTVEQFRSDYPNELYDYNPYNAITFR